MGYNVEKFKSSNYQDRTAVVPVPGLPDNEFDSPDDPKEFLVRGLTGLDLDIVENAHVRAKNAERLIDEATSGFDREQIRLLKQKVGFLTGDNTEPLEASIKNYNIMALGCVSPKMSVQDAVAFYRDHPIEARQTIFQILALTGQGRMSGLTPSGDAPTSGPVSPSVPGGKAKGAGKGSCTK